MQDITENSKEVSSYKDRLNTILSTKLTLDNIDNYGEGALGSLIELISSCISQYKFTPEYINSGAVDEYTLENKALEHYGLPNVDIIIDQIIEVIDQIKGLDKTINEVKEKISDLIVPPESSGFDLPEAGEDKYLIAELKPKLKTLIFILINEFGLDLEDGTQIHIKEGEVTPNMVRRTSYNLVETPTIGRTTLVCDEEGNITYVFNNDKLPDGIKPQDLLGMTKVELNNLIESGENIGERIVQKSKYVPNLIRALYEPNSNRRIESEDNDESDNFLVPKAPKGYLSRVSIAKALGFGQDAIQKAIDSLGESLGEVKEYKYVSNSTTGYSPEQQEMIKQELDRLGLLVPIPPEGFLSLTGIKKALGPACVTIQKAIDSLGESLGEVKEYKFRSSTVPGYSPEQQEMIKQELDRLGLLVPIPPEGFLSCIGISKALGPASEVIQKAIDSLGDALGEVNEYKFVNTITIGYSPEQQEMIKQELDRLGLLAPTAPEGYLALKGMAEALRAGDRRIQKAIDSLGDALGEVNEYKFVNTITTGYSPEQQEMIKQELDRLGLLAPTAPEGILSCIGISKALGPAREVIQKAIDSLGVTLGEVKEYQFGGVRAPGYSPEQQEMIKQELDRLGLLAPTAPVGYLSLNGMAEALRAGNRRIQKAIDSLGVTLGEVKEYKFYSAIVPGYSPEQVDMIKQKLGKA